MLRPLIFLLFPAFCADPKLMGGGTVPPEKHSPPAQQQSQPAELKPPLSQVEKSKKSDVPPAVD